MHEYKTFVYLDMQKTGSTFISALLEKVSNETLIRHRVHAPMEPDYDRSKFYFISVRNPIDAYLSLYSFGCEDRGNMRKKFGAQGVESLYDGTMEGFSAWMEYILKPRNVSEFVGSYANLGEVSRLIGLQSYRYLRLALTEADTKLSACRTEEDIRALYRAERIPQFVVRHEHFAEDLCALLKGPLRHAVRDLDEALNLARNGVPMNTSRRVDGFGTEVRLPKSVRKKYMKREWFLHEEFGY
jgi:hypothetical protein